MVQGLDGIAVGGTGSPASPITVALDLTKGTGCAKVMDCVCSHAKDGLRCDPATKDIAVKIDSTAGNTTVIGNNGGIYTPGCVGCGNILTVDMLPTNGVHGGDIGAGSMIAPPWTRESYDLGFALYPSCQLFDVDVRVASDRTYWWRNSDESVTPFKWNSLLIDDAARINPWYAMQWNLLEWSPPSADVIYNFYDDNTPHNPLSLYQILSTMGGKVIVVLRYTTSSTVAIGEMQAMIKQLGIIKSVIWSVSVAQYNDAKAWAAQGGEAAVRIASTAEASSLDPVNLVNDGIKTVFINASAGAVTDAQVTRYVTAGLRVIGNTPRTMVDARRMKNLGAKGVKSNDPVYHQGPWSGYHHRQTKDPFANMRFWPGTGPLVGTSETSRGRFVPKFPTSINPNPDTYYALPVVSGHTLILQGWACPVAAPSAYTVAWVQRQSASVGDAANQHFGVLFSASNDAATLLTDSTLSCYGAGLFNNTIRCFKIVNGVFTQLASVAQPGAGVEFSFSCQVTTTGVLFKYGVDVLPSLTLLNSSDTSVPRTGGEFIYTYQARTAAGGSYEIWFRKMEIT